MIFDFGIRQPPTALIESRGMFATYFTAATFLVLIVAELAVIAFSALTFQNRQKFGNDDRTWMYFGVPTISLFVAAFVTFQGSKMYCDTVIDPVNAIGRPTFGITLGADLLHVLDQALAVSGGLAFIAVAAILAAVCALDPKEIWKLESGNDVEQSRIPTARAEIAYGIRWMKYYVFAAALLLVIGVYCLKTWTAWPLAYFHEDEMAKAQAFVREKATAAMLAFFAIRRDGADKVRRFDIRACVSEV